MRKKVDENMEERAEMWRRGKNVEKGKMWRREEKMWRKVKNVEEREKYVEGRKKNVEERKKLGGEGKKVWIRKVDEQRAGK